MKPQADFATRLLHWFDRHGRHDLPWQHPRTPYRVWLSEVMLQQTQVTTVIPYFERFLQRFPDVRTLAAAPVDEVLALWSGLGYYARARNLHACAKAVVAHHGGEFPRGIEELTALPGIGRSTAGAILAQAHGLRHAILDGNVRRVLARHAAIEGWTGEPRVQKKLWVLSESLLPQTRLADYTQAIMDLGAGLCRARKPACMQCPLSDDCAAHAQGRTHELPASKPKRERPQRRTQMLLIENTSGELLLERRPPAGIWGGLWCLPMIEEQADAAAHCRERYGLRTGPATPLPAIQHGFSHYDLEILPVHLHAKAAAGVAEGATLAWTKMSTLSAIGLPAPVRKLLESPARTSENPPCPEPSTASSSAPKPKPSTARPTRVRSASASTKASRSKAGSSGSRTRRG